MEGYGYPVPVALQAAAVVPTQQTGNFNVSGYGVVPTIYGSLVANGDLTLEGTQHATKTSSAIILQPSGGLVGIGVTPTTAALEIESTGQVFIGTRVAAGSSAAAFAFRKATTGTTAVANGDEIAAFNFSGHDGAGYILTSRIQVIVDGVVSTNTVPMKQVFVTGTTAANRTERFTIYSSGLIVANETGADADFRIEGDTEQNLFFVDASTDLVGIGTATPGARLDIVGGNARVYATSGSPALYIGSTTGAANEGLEIQYEFGNDLARITSIERGTAYRGLVLEGGSILMQTGSGSVTESMNIDVNKNVSIGSGALATNATDGFLYIPTCAGVPTGTPTAKTGRVPIIYDSTNNKVMVYDGAWVGVAVA